MSTTKHLRLTIDFHITIADEPPLLPLGTINPPDADPNYDARQARLLAAVKNNPQMLTRWLREIVAGKMYNHSYGGDWDWYDLLVGGEKPFSDILVPILETLSPEDREYFDEVIGLDVFEECIDMFMQSFTVEEYKPVLVDPEEQRRQKNAAVDAAIRVAEMQALEQALEKYPRKGKKRKVRMVERLLRHMQEEDAAAKIWNEIESIQEHNRKLLEDLQLEQDSTHAMVVPDRKSGED